jgi:CheY-like chemotaxis protein
MAGLRPRILIVDDHDGFRTVARTLLEDDGFEVVGEVADGAGAIAAASTLRPGIVLLDVHLPDVDGFAGSDQLAALPAPAGGGADLEPADQRPAPPPPKESCGRLPGEA